MSKKVNDFYFFALNFYFTLRYFGVLRSIAHSFWTSIWSQQKWKIMSKKKILQMFFLLQIKLKTPCLGVRSRYFYIQYLQSVCICFDDGKMFIFILFNLIFWVFTKHTLILYFSNLKSWKKTISFLYFLEEQHQNRRNLLISSLKKMFLWVKMDDLAWKYFMFRKKTWFDHHFDLFIFSKLLGTANILI